MTSAVSGWGAVWHGDPRPETVERLWAIAVDAAGPECPGYLLERLADQQVTLEAAAAASAHLGDSLARLAGPASDLLEPLTRWRVLRDLALVSTELGLLVGSDPTPRLSATAPSRRSPRPRAGCSQPVHPA